MSKASSPIISVILPVYNAEKFLVSSIDSILNQTFQNFELIIIDDASTDSSPEIISRYATRYPKKIITIQNATHQKIATTLNRGIAIARGKYLARMDADDVALPHRFQLQIDYLEKHPQTVIVGGQCYCIDISDKVTGTKRFPAKHADIYEALYTRNPLQHPATMINRSLIPDNFTWYHPDLPPAEDLDLFFRLARYGRFANLKDFVLFYRQHPDSQTFLNPKRTFATTDAVRRLAVTSYGYRPSSRARLIHIIQKLALTILPNSVIFPLYTFLKTSRNETTLTRVVNFQNLTPSFLTDI